MAGASAHSLPRARGAPLVPDVDVSSLLVEEAELGLLVARLGVVGLLFALGLSTDPRHGWARGLPSWPVLGSRGPELTILSVRSIESFARAKAAQRREGRAERGEGGRGLFWRPR